MVEVEAITQSRMSVNTHSHTTKHYFRIVVVAVAVLCVSQHLAAAEPAVKATEYELKAAFLYKLLLFVEWPAGHFENEKTPIVLAVLGKDPFGKILETTVAGQEIHGRPVKIERYKKLEDAKSGDVVFVCKSEEERLPEILKHYGGKSVLTVGEANEFVENGGIVSLTAGQTLKLSVNIDAARGAQIRLNPQLLRVARVVHNKEDE